MPPRFTRLAWTADACTYLLIVLGAVVRITGSGMGCGDHWPLCLGKLFPPLDDIGTLIEWNHRLAAAAVSVLVVALAGYAWRLRRDTGHGNRGTSNGPITYRPPPPRGGGVRRACVARRAGGAGGRHREARAPALDGDPAPRHGDAAARDPDRRREGGSNSPALTGGA